MRTRQRMREDTKRRNARQMQDDLALMTAPGSVDPYLWSRGITGVPSAANRTFSASPSCWNTSVMIDALERVRITAKSKRCIGIAPGTELLSDGTPTVRVIRGDVSRVVPVSDFRPARATRAAVRVSRVIAPEVASLPSIRAGEA